MTVRTYPSLAGVGIAELTRPPPKSESCASRSFCSMASARRLRKSERLTRPTVCACSTSSAVLLCEVKRGLGVEARDPGCDAIDALREVINRLYDVVF